MLTDSIAIKLIDFYKGSTTREIKRTEVKIIVDSLIEQLCKLFFQKYPNGIANVRALINSSPAKSNDNKEVLQNFDQMLRSYHDAFSKSYSDHSYNFNAFLNGELKTLILVLIRYNYINDVQLSKELRELVQ